MNCSCHISDEPILRDSVLWCICDLVIIISILVPINLDQIFHQVKLVFSSRRFMFVYGAHSICRNGDYAVKNTMVVMNLLFGHRLIFSFRIFIFLVAVYISGRV